MDGIPVSFDYKEKHYEGKLSQVHGAGAQVWHLMINNNYYGMLMYTDKWVFHSNSGEMGDLAELFGNQVMLWYE